jgi:hypothetical protein
MSKTKILNKMKLYNKKRQIQKKIKPIMMKLMKKVKIRKK